MRVLLILLLIPLLSGCGFYGTCRKVEEGEYEWNASAPCSIKHPDGFTVDGKQEPWIKIRTPDFPLTKVNP